MWIEDLINKLNDIKDNYGNVDVFLELDDVDDDWGEDSGIWLNGVIKNFDIIDDHGYKCLCINNMER